MTHALVFNSGSSSLKFGLYRAGASGAEALLSGEAEGLGRSSSLFRAGDAAARVAIRETEPLAGLPEAMSRISTLLLDLRVPLPAVIGHRIVHGGPSLRRHCRIDGPVLEAMQSAAAFAPLHVPEALAIVRMAGERYPGTPQVACFDTAFHHGMPDVARVLPIPSQLQAEGLQRYGFHGLSCESIVQQFGDALPRRLVIAHLGSGASITAVRDGRSVDTSMGLTPSGGMIMATRSGDLDPGVLVYLARHRKMDADALEDLIDRRSGLLGLSNLDGDMRRLHEAAATSHEARLAIGMFCYSAIKQIAAMAAALNGVDAIAFTGGIGENDPAVRAQICAGLAWLGVTLDPARNLEATHPIDAPQSSCRVHVLASRENEQIAAHALSLL